MQVRLVNWADMAIISRRKADPGIFGPRSVSSPAYLTGVLLVGLPLVVITLFSFLQRGEFGSGVIYKFTLDAYRTVFFETDLRGNKSFNFTYLSIIFRSITLAFTVTVICLFVGIPTAIWIALQKKSTQRILIMLVTIPFWVNVLARTYAWMLLLADGGLFTQLGAPALLYTSWATFIGLTYAFLPFMILPIYASAEKLDKRVLEAAFDLGASGWRVLIHIVLPMIKFGIFAGIAIVFIPALGAYIQPTLLGGNKTMLIGSLINDQFGESRNWPVGSALAVLLLVMTGLILLSTRRRKLELAR
jgi:spermidine/putrescine transport system permease protein